MWPDFNRRMNMTGQIRAARLLLYRQPSTKEWILKIIDADPAAVSVFITEAKSSARVSHCDIAGGNWDANWGYIYHAQTSADTAVQAHAELVARNLGLEIFRQ